ncbi:MAG: SDR family NAD(P)-dependent oxidoreductase [Anaerolineae bacterium]|nr:SDR family NAD(P)-dependent oxidoreductase [Anaerolineae bacterium]
MSTWLITGGAGFIGSNTAHALLKSGHRVIIVDNLSREGSKKNLHWLQATHEGLQFERVDVREYAALRAVIERHADIDALVHLAAQVAVTTSVVNPREDFEINALGALNVLEAVRETGINPAILYASTNKVYGGMETIQIGETETRYYYEDLPEGVSEEMPLDFHSPYGCSKGSADQYMRDYHRIYGLRTIVFRNSCIYGPRQFGVEDQGWVAWFIIAALLQRPLTIYGNGKQVRDILFVADLVQAFLKAVERIDQTAGQIYNMGGGPENTLAVWSEFQPLLSELFARPITAAYADWRPGDQKVYVSNTAKARRELDWEPEVNVRQGIKRLYEWVVANRGLFEDV